MGSTLQQIDQGPTFEVFQGPLSVQRHDWNKKGGVRLIVVGFATAENAALAKERYTELQRPNTRWTKMYDFWEMTGYEPAFRADLLKFAQTHLSTTDGIHALNRTKVMNMGISVTSLALPGLVKGYETRAEFDALCKKLGLPLNPPMPAVAGGGRG
jgi:hypothetical protein